MLEARLHCSNWLETTREGSKWTWNYVLDVLGLAMNMPIVSDAVPVTWSVRQWPLLIIDDANDAEDGDAPDFAAGGGMPTASQRGLSHGKNCLWTSQLGGGS